MVRNSFAGLSVPLSLACCILIAVLASASVVAQEGPPETRQFPSALEATDHYRSLNGRAAEAEDALEALSDTTPLELSLNEAEVRLQEISGLVTSVIEAEYMRPERIGRIRDQARQVEIRLEAVRDEAFERIAQLDEMRSDWVHQQSFWRDWQQALRGDPQFSAVAPQFRRALERIEEVISLIDQALPELLTVQEAAGALRVDAEQSVALVATIQDRRREALLDRTEPLLFSREHRAELSIETVRQWQPAATFQPVALLGFVRDNVGLLLLHLLLILGFVVAARRLRRFSIPEGAWSGLLLRPRALAVFAATALLSPRYALAPPIWDVVAWTLLAGSGAVLATRLLRGKPWRVMVYYFAATYPILLLLEALVTPHAIFRIVLSAAALGGIASFAYLLRREIVRPQRVYPILIALEIGIALWFAVLVSEVAGFYMLARWILHATVTSAFVVFVVVFLIVLATGALKTLVRIETGDRFRFLQETGVPLVRQLIKLFQIVLVIAAALHVLHIWELTPPPGETWSVITGVGVTVAGVNVTLARVLTGVILLYVVISFSWVLRSFAREEVYPRWELERGVGDSINAIVHYLLITIGFFAALAALGVELQSFMIVLGALGVGIGFGLQNIVNNFISGLILIFERPVRIGDTVVLGSELGTIEKIGLRSTTVLTFDRAEVIVPNADLISEKVTNWTLTDPVARVIIPVGVAYGSNVALVLELLQEAAREHPEVMTDPPAQVLFKEFGDSALEFEMRIWVQELRLRWQVRSEILAKIDRLFRENDIEIPFPQRDLHLRSVDGKILSAAMSGRPPVIDSPSKARKDESQ